MKRPWLPGILILVLLSFALTPVAARAEKRPFQFNLVPASPAIEACLPNATARITVLPSEVRGLDTMDVKAEGLPPNTDFVVFLTEKPASAVPPFGAVQYMADFTTNAAGRGSVRVDAIILEAFSSQICDGVRVRKDLNHVTIWFADPGGDDVCFGPGGGPTTPFDGDGAAGAAALSSNFSPAPLPLP